MFVSLMATSLRWEKSLFKYFFSLNLKQNLINPKNFNRGLISNLCLAKFFLN